MSDLIKIVHTMLQRGWQDIGQLAAIVGARTVLNFFLIRELKQVESQKSDVQN